MKHIMMIMALCAASCVSPEAHRALQRKNEVLAIENDELRQGMRDLAARAERLEAENQDLGARAADAEWIKQQKKKIGDLLARYGESSPTKVQGVELVPTTEGYAFRVAGGVLFEPGQNTLSDGGKRTLKELVESLQGRRLRVEGHTDDTPIVRSRWGTNLRLSVERAMSVADYLIASGIPQQQVSVAGYGEFRPAVEGSTEEARKTNRRVEILMLER